MNIDTPAPHSRFIRRITHSCEMALNVGFVAFVVTAAPTIAYVSLITRLLALAGFGAGILLSGGISGTIMDRRVALGTFAGFTVGLAVETITGMNGTDIDRVSYAAFAAARFFLCAGRMAMEAAMLHSVLLGAQTLLEYRNKLYSPKLATTARVSVTVLLSLAVLVLIEYRTGR